MTCTSRLPVCNVPDYGTTEVADTAIAPKTKARETAAKIGSDPTVVRLLWEFVGVMIERTWEGSWVFANYQGRS